MRRPEWADGKKGATWGGALAIAALYGGMVAFGAGLPGVGIALLLLGVLLAGFAWDAGKSRR